MALVVGVMGWFASGKSEACRFLVNKGFHEIDADLLGKDALKILKDEVVGIFGSEILENNIISPKKLGNIVFNSADEMKRLNAVVHPWIKEQVKSIIDENKHSKILVNAAILPQLGLKDLCDVVLMIDSEKADLIARGQARNNFPPEKIESILDMQKSSNDYFNTADAIIKNTGTLHDFHNKLEGFYGQLEEESHDFTGRKPN